jgi:hypothetical protein
MVSLNHRRNAGWLAVVALVLTGCGSGQSPAAHQVAAHGTTATSRPAPATSPIRSSARPSSAVVASSKAEVPTSKAATTAPRPVASAAPTSKTSAAKPKLAVAPKPTAAAGLCGAPANPFGYTFCGGQVITAPDPAVCDYFNCIPYFPNGKGYMEQCRDGMYSMSGGRRGACSSHGGEAQPVLKR